MTEAASADHPVDAEKKKRLFDRIPTSLLVTLLGIALTAWFLPAFTRQWDDRQKAHELKAALASQVAVATAKSMTRSREQLRIVLANPKGAEGMFPEVFTHLDESWFADSVEIEAKMRSEFDSPALLSALHNYNATMGTLFQLSSDPWTMYDYSHGPDSLSTARQQARLLGIGTKELRLDLLELVGPSSSTFAAPGGANDYLFTRIANGVLAKEQALTDRIATAHAKGYSTTSHDLLHDLFP